MREISITLSEGLNKGLRRDSKNPRNSESLVEAYNVKCGIIGLEPFTPLLTDITSPDLAGTHTPQLFNTGMGLHIATDIGVYPVLDDLTVGPIGDGITSVNVLGWPKWSLADFGGFHYWCDGEILYLGVPGTYAVYATTVNLPLGVDGVANIIKVGAFGGRLFINCIPYYDSVGVGDPLDFVFYPLYRNKVLWSRAGDAGATTIARMMNLLTGYTTGFDDTQMIGYGLLAMPWYGTVQCLKKLGKAMMVYGSPDEWATPGTGLSSISPLKGGIGAMIQYTDPYPTFGYEHVSDIGVPRGRPIDGDDDHHVYVDMDGVVWRITSDFKKERLGYEEFIKPLLDAGNYYIFVSHDPIDDEFYITGVTTGYLLDKGGLTKIYQPVVSVAPVTSSLITGVIARSKQAICRTLGTDLSAVICTDVFDFGIRGIKTITGLEIGGYSTGILSAAVDYRYNTNEAFTTSSYKIASRSGTVTPIVSGVEFRVRVKSSTLTDFDLDYVVVRAKLVDKRMVRGIYESKTVKATA